MTDIRARETAHKLVEVCSQQQLTVHEAEVALHRAKLIIRDQARVGAAPALSTQHSE